MLMCLVNNNNGGIRYYILLYVLMVQSRTLCLLIAFVGGYRVTRINSQYKNYKLTRYSLLA